MPREEARAGATTIKRQLEKHEEEKATLKRWEGNMEIQEGVNDRLKARKTGTRNWLAKEEGIVGSPQEAIALIQRRCERLYAREGPPTEKKVATLTKEVLRMQWQGLDKHHFEAAKRFVRGRQGTNEWRAEKTNASPKRSTTGCRRSSTDGSRRRKCPSKSPNTGWKIFRT